MPEVHVLTLAANLPLPLLDGVLTATEQALGNLGISKVWIAVEGRDLKVLADVPLCFGTGPVDHAEGGCSA